MDFSEQIRKLVQERLFNINQLASWVIDTSQDTATVLVISNKKGTITIENKITAKPLSEIFSLLPARLPIILTLVGKKILHKSSFVELEDEPENPVVSLQKILPNINTNDFSVQINSINAQRWLSIIRRDILNHYLTTITNQHFSIIGVQLGFFSFQHIVSLIEKDCVAIALDGFKLELYQNKIIEVVSSSTATSVINLNGETLRVNAGLAFATAFQFLYLNPPPISAAELLTELQEQFRYQQVFHRGATTVGTAIFFLLIINFGLFQYFSRQNSLLHQQLSIYRSELTQLDTLRVELKQKIDFFSKNNLLGTSKQSFYADQIGATVPPDVKLLELTVFPLEREPKKLSGEESLNFNPQLVYLKASALQSTAINFWLKDLENLRWVKDVELQPYSEQFNGISNFELSVVLSK